MVNEVHGHIHKTFGGFYMTKPDNKRDLEVLIAVTKKNRAQLQKTWKKIAELKAAIQSVKNGERHPENKN